MKLPAPLDYIEALGHLLSTYYADLTHIRDFQAYVRSSPDTLYLNTFRHFINEFKVARNSPKDRRKELLECTLEWVRKPQPERDNVDGFVEDLQRHDLTHGKTATSLASKILFLNHPQAIVPFDSLGRTALGLRGKVRYADYLNCFTRFRESQRNEIKAHLTLGDAFISTIESEFKDKLCDLDSIRLNRYTDKLLWTLGRRQKAETHD